MATPKGEEELDRKLAAAVRKAVEMVSYTICLNCCNLELLEDERIYRCYLSLSPGGNITAFIDPPFQFVTELTEEELCQVCPGYNPHDRGVITSEGGGSHTLPKEL